MAMKADPDPMITKSMARQEEAFKQAELKRQSKADKQVVEINAQEESARVARLKFLIEKSKIYTSILSEKLMNQQAALKTRGEEANSQEDKVRKVQDTYEISNPSNADDLSERNEDSSTTKALKNATNTQRKGKTKAQMSKAANPRQDKPDLSMSARQPTLVTGGIMRDYQLAGLEWMVSLYENGLNGILADEMGLGKTLQTISFLAFLRTKGVLGPFLVAAPLSTVANWVNEVRKFTPGMPVLLYHGTKDERAALRSKYLGKVDNEFPIVVTSYEIIMNDRKFLQKYLWKYIVVDEGHRLKNLNCRLIKELKSYRSANRLLLTGTPLQNNLSELWSLLNFLLPDIFSDLDSFQSWFDFSSLDDNVNGNLVNEKQQSSIISQLHQILKPFLLRRLKTDVERNLPKKREYLLYAPMTAEQTKLYKAILNKNIEGYYQDQDEVVQSTAIKRKRKADQLEKGSIVDTKRVRKEIGSLRETTDKEWFAAPQESLLEIRTEDKATKQEQGKVSHLKLQNMLMNLRKACNHPFQMDWPVYPGTDDYIVNKSIVNCSGKMLLLQRLLKALFAQKHKVLIFSQFTSMLDILEAWSEDIEGLHICRIDGNVDQDTRRSQIADFNTNADCRLFLLSTRAGGLGINLTSADTVILFDSDWNPQVDLQAMDRVHRIGQKKPVIVYRLVSANTIETRILEKASGKRRLEKVVIQKDQFKSIISGGGNLTKDAMSQLSNLLLSEDAESIQVKSENDEIISDGDLAKIMDRSDAAYETQEISANSSVFTSVTTIRDKENDELAS